MTGKRKIQRNRSSSAIPLPKLTEHDDWMRWRAEVWQNSPLRLSADISTAQPKDLSQDKSWSSKQSSPH